MLTANELKRYQRQLKIFGKEGQEKLKAAKVFIGGLGGLGSTASIYLASAGIGQIRIVDKDYIDLSNLNRQILYRNDDVGKVKAKQAKAELEKINPNVNIEAIPKALNDNNVCELIGDCNIIVDAMDNFRTRHLLNKAALLKRIPLVHGAVNGFYGQVTTIVPGKTACLKCIFPQSPPNLIWPVISVTCGIVGCIQATEVIKYIIGIGNLLENKLLMLDGLSMSIEEIAIKRNPLCKECSCVEGEFVEGKSV